MLVGLVGCSAAEAPASDAGSDAAIDTPDASVPRVCPACVAPFRCGGVDLQEWGPTEGRCVLDCSYRGISERCPEVLPTLYSCASTPELLAFYDSDAFDRRYACTMTATGSSLTFCCGL